MAFAIDYVNADGTPGTDPGAASALPLSGGGTLTTGWYYVSGNVTASGILINGDVKIILTDGCALTANGPVNQAGITVIPGNTLTIYGQSGGTGSLTATGDGGGAGIGGNNGSDGGTINISGGTVTANGDNFGAGIGGGGHFSSLGGNGGTITISGGKVTAKGGSYGSTLSAGGAGIGGGGNYGSGNSGGGGTVTISGGMVTANGGGGGAGIGGGGSNSNNGGSGGAITIIGGTVNVTGTSAGIGGGRSSGSGNGGDGGAITITGGTVNATALGGAGIGGGGNIGSSAGIGAGYGGDGGAITISGGTVTANGSSGSAGIGGGRGGNGANSNGGGGGAITISGQAIVKATKGSGSSAIYDIGPGWGVSVTGSPATVIITGGSVEATNNTISNTPTNGSNTLSRVTYPTSGTATGSFSLAVAGAPDYPFTMPSPGPAHLWLPSPMNIIEIMNAQANGSPGTETSTLISFDIFNISPPVIADLSASNFWLNSATGQATLGSLHSGNINPWTIDIASVSAEGRVYFGFEPPVGYAYLLADLSFDVYKAADSSTFVPVTNIKDVPTLTPERTPLTLSGTVEPQDATYKTIVWSVLNAGATGATVSGDTLNTRLSGTVNVLATIISGLEDSPVSTDYKQSFDITVRPLTAPELVAESVRDNSGLDAIASGDVITVLGDQVGVSTLTIDTTQSPGARIQWNASYKGSLSLPLVIVRGNGVIELGTNANISNTMGSALTSEGDIIISGAVIEANGDYATAVFSEKNISMSSGSVFANGMDGMALFAALNVTLTGGSLSATGERGLAVHALGTLTTNDSALITPSQAIKAEGGITHIDSNNSKGSGGGCDVGFGFGTIALALLMALARKK